MILLVSAVWHGRYRLPFIYRPLCICQAIITSIDIELTQNATNAMLYAVFTFYIVIHYLHLSILVTHNTTFD